MIMKARNAVIGFICLIAFVVMGAQIVRDFHTWECRCTHIECRWCEDEFTWVDFHMDAFEEAANEFTALFEAIEFKCSKNGRSMIRRPGDKGFRFVKSA